MTPPRDDYPRPQFVRERWASLNGEWAFAFDDADKGLEDRWFAVRSDRLGDPPLDRRIIVPFAYQSQLSGIHERARHDVVWYAREFHDVRRAKADERLLLHFGAVDYHATVWVNGQQVAEHHGGHTPFSVDVTHALTTDGGNVLVVRAADPLADLELPRGKQFWRLRSENIFYTATTGIWQSVWLEPVPRRHVSAVRITPDLDNAAVHLSIDVAAQPGDILRIVVAHEGVTFVDDRVTVPDRRVQRRYSVAPPQSQQGGRVADWQGVAAWSPEDPSLHDLRLELGEAHAQPDDVVDAYFGMRKVDTHRGGVRLNGRPYYLRLVLDQGYFPGGNLTAASDDDLRRDIELAKEMGFNGARKHQKIEDPRWLYWADRLGFLVWEEMPSAYGFSTASVTRLTTEWQEVIARDRNHPCIVAWVPFNESWGVPRLASDPSQRACLLALYHLTRTLDGSRLVVSNDGWEHARSDLCTIHDYALPAALADRYASLESALSAEPCGRPLYVQDHGHAGEPLILSEFGGVALAHEPATWGYHTVANGEGLLSNYRELVAAVVASPVLQGFCYTQLTDVEQEANGLLTFERKPKAELSEIRKATEQEAQPNDHRRPERGREERDAQPERY